MGAKIKANDDRIQIAAVAVLLLVRERMRRGQTGDVITTALAEFRADYAGYKMNHPRRTFADAKDASSLTDASLRARYLKLSAAMDTLLGRIARHKTEFSSLLELDNYLALHLKTFN